MSEELEKKIISQLIDDLQEEHFTLCPFCGEPFIPRDERQVTCGNKECQKERHKQTDKKWKENRPQEQAIRAREKHRLYMQRRRAIEHIVKADTLAGYKANKKLFKENS